MNQNTRQLLQTTQRTINQSSRQLLQTTQRTIIIRTLANYYNYSANY